MKKCFFCDRGLVMTNLSEEEQKRIYMESLERFWEKKWNEAYNSFGRWAIHIIAAGVVVATAYGLAYMSGWRLLPPNG